MVLTAMTGPLTALPWLPVRRISLGLLYDLPAVLSVVVLLALAGRVIVLRPWVHAVALVASVWVLDLAGAWLVLNDFGLWTDWLVLLPRLLMAGLAVLAGALVLGWRPRRRARRADATETEGRGEDEVPPDEV